MANSKEVQENDKVQSQQILPDSKTVLVDGTGTPYLAIFDGGENPIFDPLSGLPIGMLTTDFEYIYDEEDDDTGHLSLECNNPDLISLDNFKYKMPLTLQWGYIYPNGNAFCGPTRKVIVIGSEVTFEESGVKIQIDFASASILLKNSPAQYFNSVDTMVDYLTKLIHSMPVSVSVRNFGPNTVYKKAIAQRIGTNSDINDGSLVADENTASPVPFIGNNEAQNTTNADRIADIRSRNTDRMTNKYGPNVVDLSLPVVQLGVQKPSVINEDVAPAVIIDYDKNKDMLELHPNTFKEVLVAEKRTTVSMICGTFKNKRGQLEDALKHVDETMYIGGRDGKVIAQPEKKSRPISKTYTYYGGSGELLRFKAKSKFVVTSSEVAKASDIDPDTGNVKTTISQVVKDPDQVNPNEVYYIPWYRQWTDQGPDVNGAENPSSGTRLVEQAPYDPTFSTRFSQNLKENQEKNKAQSQGASWKKQNSMVASGPGLAYNSEEEARAAIQNNPGITQEEFDAYMTSIKQRSDQLFGTTADSGPQIAENIKNINDFPTWTIKRRVRVKYTTSMVTKEDVQAVYQGLDDYHNAPGYEGNWEGEKTVALNKKWEAAFEHLAANKNVEILGVQESRQGGVSWDNTNIRRKFLDKVTYITEKELEIEIDGMKMMGSDLFATSNISLMNDIVRTVTHQITAEATVVGDPSLESSCNMRIQNVSAKYSTVWYSKKVTHRLNPSSGYLCDIDFVQNNTPISKIVIDGTMVTKKALATIQGEKEKAEATGSYKMRDVVEATVKQVEAQYPPDEYSNITYYNEKEGKVEVFVSDADFSTVKAESPEELEAQGYEVKKVAEIKL